MNLIPYLIVTGLLCIIGLVTTVMIGINPKGEDYNKKQKEHFIKLSVLYIVAFVPAVILTILYFVYF
ncbi:hypothetical protein QA612_20225 [Evansella sp. AB-P1]|uniref:hypothetical protein n=1 Tax=Evansella sp. AB-P1 TaxID=3037653 RepID=UPI00241E2039|nr:hypothetical protein [Evansella sp. AB-P1]MDG5789789.1 hypothetical protein [Evansella sp. AB-P1]